MVDTVTMRVDGAQELARALKAFGPKIAQNGLRAAVNAGATVVRKEVEARAPIGESGTLKRAIFQKALRDLSGRDRAVFVVGLKRGKKYRNVKRGKKTVNQDAYYWTWVEFGHMVVPRGGRGSIRSRRRVASSVGRRVQPRPFMRPAFEQSKYAALEAIKQKLRDRIDEERRRAFR
jgi:HK97 gp10 family phage protein